MNNGLVTFFLNILAGVLAYYVTKFLDSNSQNLLRYTVFLLFIIFIIFGSYFNFKNSLHPSIKVPDQDGEKVIQEDKQNNKPEIFHKILRTVVKLAAQHVDATPKKIGELINESPEIVLAYLKEMEGEFIVVYTSGGKPPDINTPFFIAYHENPWKYIKIEPR